MCVDDALQRLKEQLLNALEEVSASWTASWCLFLH